MQKARKRFFRLPVRCRILSDDDGHTYFVPVGQEKAFQAWLDAGPYWEDYEGLDYRCYEIGSSLSCFTFSNPERAE
jgi:hypothetical protein